MKKIFLFVLVSITMAGAKDCHAQTFGEWTSQDKTQQRYLLEQIAKLQVYLGYVKKGYNIVSKGLNTIGDIKNGDFDLHQLFFDSRGAVSPVVKKYSRVEDIIRLQAGMMTISRKFLNQCREGGVFNKEELTYFDAVLTALLEQVATDMENLTTVLTNGELLMTDDERIKEIDKIHEQMQHKHAFILSFCGEGQMQSNQIKKELKDIETLQKLYKP